MTENKTETIEKQLNKQEKKVMKTTNNVQKTDLRAIAAGLVLATLGFGVNAQGALTPDFNNNSKNQMAFAGVIKKSTSHFNPTEKSDFSADAFYASATDEPLKVEAWMTDASYFEAASAVFETAADEELLIEEWMINEKTFEGVAERDLSVKKNNYTIYSTEKYVIREIITEPVLQFEKWMFNNNLWK